MAQSLSLRRQLESMNTGDVIVTTQPRTGVYVAAKRAGFKVSTREVDEGTEVTIGAKLVKAPEPKISQFDAVLKTVREWTTETRLKLFENFELCCGMNRGECVCPVETPMSAQAKVMVTRGMLNSELADSVKVEVLSELASVPVEDWQFTKDRPQWETPDTVYRQQFLGKSRRTVRVDADDIDRIIEVC